MSLGSALPSQVLRQHFWLVNTFKRIENATEFIKISSKIDIFDERHVPPTQLGDGPQFFRFFRDTFPKGLHRFLDMLELQPFWNYFKVSVQ